MTTPPPDPEKIDITIETEEEPRFTVPNHKVSRDKGRKLFSPAGDKPGERPKVKPVGRTKPVIPNRKGQFVQPVMQLYMAIAMFLMPIDPVCANAIITHAENAAKAWDAYAYQNNVVREFLWRITQTSVAAGVFMANLPILAAIMVHHFPPAQKVLGNLGQDMADQIAEHFAKNPPNEGGEGV